MSLDMAALLADCAAIGVGGVGDCSITTPDKGAAVVTLRAGGDAVTAVFGVPAEREDGLATKFAAGLGTGAAGKRVSSAIAGATRASASKDEERRDVL